IFLCLLFGSSSALASAYGIAVSGTMLVTTCFVSSVIYKVWKRSLAFTICAVLPFFCIEIVFFTANLLKIFDGGYVPMMLAGFLVLLMYTWVAGTNYLRRRDHRRAIALTDLMEKLDRNPPALVPGTALFLTSNAHDAPIALIQNLKHNKVLHQHNYVMTIVTTEMPKVPDNLRLQVEVMSSSITRMVVSFGYMETPDVPKALILARQQGIDIDIGETSFFLGKRSIISDAKRGLPEWQDHIYIAMAKSAASATDFYRIPYNQVVELGTQIAV
ncbi:MAG TPA: KUP/HAK/KT family potassium transporter, partial [Micavibrio sp.]